MQLNMNRAKQGQHKQRTEKTKRNLEKGVKESHDC